MKLTSGLKIIDFAIHPQHKYYDTRFLFDVDRLVAVDRSKLEHNQQQINRSDLTDDRFTDRGHTDILLFFHATSFIGTFMSV